MPYRYPRPTKHRLLRKRAAAGIGLFTMDPIKREEFVIEYWGPLLTKEETNAKAGKYLFETEDDRWTIDGSGRENLARYINHSCKPNCESILDGKRIFIHAKRNIKAGEELTYDYGKDYFDHMIKPYGCRCGHHT